MPTPVGVPETTPVVGPTDTPAGSVPAPREYEVTPEGVTVGFSGVMATPVATVAGLVYDSVGVTSTVRLTGLLVSVEAPFRALIVNV